LISVYTFVTLVTLYYDYKMYGFVVRQCRVEGGTTAEADGDIPLKAPSQWKPLLLLIPLRLGLNEINPIYINGLKVKMKIKNLHVA